MTLASKQFGDLITFTRASGGGRFNAFGQYEWLAADLPRFDYDPLTLEIKGLLIEEQRTNLCTDSETISADWNTGVTSNAVTAPDGAVTADLLYETTATGEHYPLDKNIALTAGTAYAFSVFVKAAPGSTRRLYLRIAANGNTFGAVFNLTALSFTTVNGPVETGYQALPGGWYRVWMTFTAAATATSVVRLQLADAAGLGIYTGDGSSGLYLWGRQVEVGAFPSSYIPTTSAQVTRAADVPTINAMSPWYRQDEGTIVVKGDLLSRAGPDKVSMDIGAGSAFGTTAYLSHIATGDALSPGTAPVNMNSSVANAGLVFRCAVALRANGAVLASGGVLGAVDTSCAMPDAPTKLTLGNGGWSGAAGYLNGHIRSLRYYPRRLSNAELQELTA